MVRVVIGCQDGHWLSVMFRVVTLVTLVSVVSDGQGGH